MPKRKESCLDWKLHKAEIRDHYLVQDLSLEGLMRYMEETHTFRATCVSPVLLYLVLFGPI